VEGFENHDRAFPVLGRRPSLKGIPFGRGRRPFGCLAGFPYHMIRNDKGSVVRLRKRALATLMVSISIRRHTFGEGYFAEKSRLKLLVIEPFAVHPGSFSYSSRHMGGIFHE